MDNVIMKRHEDGKATISFTTMLTAEPLALYVNGNSHELSLALSDGGRLPLGKFVECPEILALLGMAEVTIESVYGGFLAAGYRVGIRHSTDIAA
ncbi:MAG: hypothetical protein WBK91_04295 [Alphaproteobacteria bacterium]